MVTPRIRVFAGPNGSGKSTIKKLVERKLGRPELLGVYINPDDIERTLKADQRLDLREYKVETTTEELRQFLSEIQWNKDNILPVLDLIRVEDNYLVCDNFEPNSLHCSCFCDFFRRKLLDAKETFSFETVMSSKDKVDLLKEGLAKGFKTYLYFVATADPDINVQRVQYRVDHDKEHDVPEEKIRSRYIRSLENLYPAAKASRRAYVFDNSTNGQEENALVLETSLEDDGEYSLIFHVEEIPQWVDDYLVQFVLA